MKVLIAMFLTLVSVFTLTIFSCAFPQTNTSEIYFTEQAYRETIQKDVPAPTEAIVADPKLHGHTTKMPQNIEEAMEHYQYVESSGFAPEVLPAVEVSQEIIYQEVYETVYTTTGVNVRTGPGIEYDILDVLPFGSSVTRTGVEDSGWSRVSYNGETAYMASEYLSIEEPVSNGPQGMAGRLTIPSVGVDVALYHCGSSSVYAARQQEIVDAVDSAAYIRQASSNGYIIADHKHQGFEAIKSCVPYETSAYIQVGTSIQRYVCTEIGSGLNLGNNLLDWNGRSLNYDPIPGGLAMYTCNENSTNVTITYWEPA